jgi:hypothetical protein
MQCASEETTSTKRRAGEWFLGSGIQEASGGVARYYFSDRKRNAPLTTEITAYCASSLVRLYKQSSDERFLNAATNAAWYLVNAWDQKCAAMPFECDTDNTRYSYFFDNGIIVRGLLNVWRECGKPEFLLTAQRCADSMATDFFDGRQFSPILELPGKSPLPYDAARWSRSPGCYQLKAAMAWHELWQVTKDERYLALYRQLLTASLASHHSFLLNSHADLPVMDRLHAYSYFLEGLLPAIDESPSANAMAAGIDRASSFVSKTAPFLRTDVVAQLLRIRLFAAQHGVRPLDEAAAEHEVSILRSFQSADSDPRLGGGFWFGRRNGELLPFMNPVSTAFCQQALEMWNERGRKLHWQSLI